MTMPCNISASKDYLLQVVQKVDKPSREEENGEIQENRRDMSLAITKSNGETRANLAKIIAKYVVMLYQNKLRCLGM